MCIKGIGVKYDQFKISLKMLVDSVDMICELYFWNFYSKSELTF